MPSVDLCCVPVLCACSWSPTHCVNTRKLTLARAIWLCILVCDSVENPQPSCDESENLFGKFCSKKFLYVLNEEAMSIQNSVIYCNRNIENVHTYSVRTMYVRKCSIIHAPWSA